MRRHLETALVALVTAGTIGLINHYAVTQTASAVLTERVDEHHRRVSHLESALDAVARTQERLSAIVERLEGRK